MYLNDAVEDVIEKTPIIFNELFLNLFKLAFDTHATEVILIIDSHLNNVHILYITDYVNGDFSVVHNSK